MHHQPITQTLTLLDSIVESWETTRTRESTLTTSITKTTTLLDQILDQGIRVKAIPQTTVTTTVAKSTTTTTKVDYWSLPAPYGRDPRNGYPYKRPLTTTKTATTITTNRTTTTVTKPATTPEPVCRVCGEPKSRWTGACFA